MQHQYDIVNTSYDNDDAKYKAALQAYRHYKKEWDAIPATLNVQKHDADTRKAIHTKKAIDTLPPIGRLRGPASPSPDTEDDEH